jgi:hypothetical protein
MREAAKLKFSDAGSSDESVVMIRHHEADTLIGAGQVGSPQCSREWNSIQPGGRKRIAQRFIAGLRSLPTKSRRDDTALWMDHEEAKKDFFRPCRAFFGLGACPAMNRWAILGRPYGTSVRCPVVPEPGRTDHDSIYSTQTPRNFRSDAGLGVVIGAENARSLLKHRERR